ncbi:MAG: hypothetical protein IPM54_43950 [Polyangiaceae bacterium]|nr:hypothetical protein [Polyangiaceae bacterium]
MFRHIVSRENLLVYANRNIDWDLRRSNLITIIEGLSPMSIVYGIMASADPTFEREAREIMLQNAHCVLAMWNLVDEVPEDLRKRAFARPNGAVALSEMQEGTAKVVSGMLLSTEQRVDKSVAALVWYIGELIRVLPPLIDRITPERQAEAIQRIAKLAASEPNPVLAKQFKWLHKAVTAPQKPVAH